MRRTLSSAAAIHLVLRARTEASHHHEAQSQNDHRHADPLLATKILRGKERHGVREFHVDFVEHHSGPVGRSLDPLPHESVARIF